MQFSNVPLVLAELYARIVSSCCRRHVTLATPTSETFVRCHVGTIPGNTPAKFEVHIFGRFGATSI